MAETFIVDDLIQLLHKQFNPLPYDKILDRSRLKQSADDNFKFDENSRKFFKRVENTVGKGEIDRYEQFQKTCFPGASKGVIVWEWVNSRGELNNIFQDDLNKILSQQSTNVRFFLSHNWIKRTELKNQGPKHTHLAMFWIFYLWRRHW